MTLMRGLLGLAMVIVLSCAAAAPAPHTGPAIQLQRYVRGVDHPVHITNDGTARLFVVEQPGVIRLVSNGQLQPKPYLDIKSEVQYGGECGLLSVAFHPQFQKNGYLYVNYTTSRPNLKTVISEFKVDPSAQQVDRMTERVILTIDQPYANHNGGQIVFGPDGFLYIGMGDGGAREDPANRAQNPQALLGKILRIDVTPRVGYAVPKDNPFVGKDGIRGEIWAFGMRNPWRFSFDRETHICYAGDVGQDIYEEIDIIQKGANYGWNLREGLHPFEKKMKPPPVEFKDAGPFIDPIAEYDHKAGLSVTGGFVYRGKSIPALVGWYLYADYSSGRIWGLKYENGKVTASSELLKQNVQPTSFGEDIDGEIYMCDYSGSIYKVAGG